jgi:crossover junction endodeoxyribonuclease RuvC
LRILGIDPGIATVGFGVIDVSGAKTAHIAHGVIETPAGERLSLRLYNINKDVSELIRIYRPDEIAVEELFFNTNLTTGISVAHGRSAAILAGEAAGIPMYEYTPLEVKKAIAGYGRAEKPQVMEMTRRLLALAAVPRPDDAADALAIALCHARHAGSGLAGLGAQVRKTI